MNNKLPKFCASACAAIISAVVLTSCGPSELDIAKGEIKKLETAAKTDQATIQDLLDRYITLRDQRDVEVDREVAKQRVELEDLQLKLDERNRAIDTRESAVIARERRFVDREKAAGRIEMLNKRRLDRLYPNLRSMRAMPWSGSAEGILGGLDVGTWDPSKEIQRVPVTLKLSPDGDRDVIPKIEVLFLNGDGFVTGSVECRWLIERIEPGEIRHESFECLWRFGPAVYWSVRNLRNAS